MHPRQPVLAALFGCLDCDLLPFGLFLRGAFGIELHNRAIGNDRRNFGGTDLDRFLHNQVHVLSLRDRLPQNDAALQRWCFRFV